jgi:tetratricopeptide (TPR) repeat protein
MRYLKLIFYTIITTQLSISQINDFIKARAFDIQGNTDSALFYYSKILESKPNEKIYIIRGNLLLRNGQAENAIDDFLKAERYRNNIASFNLAMSYANIHDTAKTILYLRKNLSSENKVTASEIQMEPAFDFIKKTNEWKNLWQHDWYSKYDQQLGELRYIYNSGDWLGVINYVSDISIHGDAIRHEMLYMRAKAYIEMENYKAAIDDYTNAISTNKHDYRYYEGRADLEMKILNFKEAESDYSSAINIAPDVFTLYKKRGFCRLELNKLDLATNDAILIMSLFASDMEALQLSAIANYKTGKYIKALEQFNVLIAGNSKNTEQHLYRARIYLKTGLIENARKDYDLIIRNDPDNAVALKERGQLKFDNNNPKGACSDWLKAEKLGDIEAGNLRWQNCK